MKRWAFILLVAAAAASCHRPSSTEQFIGGAGPFRFAVDMTDTTARYSFDLFTRIDAREFPSPLRLEIAWRTPADSVFTETVYLPVTGSTSFFSHEAYAPYRADVSPAEWGEWTLEITVPDRPEGFRGMGLVTRKVWDTEN